MSYITSNFNSKEELVAAASKGPKNLSTLFKKCLAECDSETANLIMSDVNLLNDHSQAFSIAKIYSKNHAPVSEDLKSTAQSNLFNHLSVEDLFALIKKTSGKKALTSDSELIIGLRNCELLASVVESQGYQSLSTDEKLRFCKLLVDKDDDYASLLAKRFSTLGLDDAPLTDKRDFACFLASQGPWSIMKVAKHLPSFGITSIQDRLDVCACYKISPIYKELNLDEVFDAFNLNEAATEEKLNLCKIIGLDADTQLTETITASLGNLGISNATSDQMFELCKALVSGADISSRFVAMISQFRLPEMTPEQRSELFKLIVVKDEGVANTAIKCISDYHDVKGFNKEQLYELCQEIISYGEVPTLALIQEFKQFREILTIEDTLNLCKQIVSAGENTAAHLAKNIDKFKFIREGNELKDPIIREQMKQLCIDIISKGDIAASELGWFKF